MGLFSIILPYVYFISYSLRFIGNLLNKAPHNGSDFTLNLTVAGFGSLDYDNDNGCGYDRPLSSKTQTSVASQAFSDAATIEELSHTPGYNASRRQILDAMKRSTAKTEAHLATEWGTSHPTLLASIIKRNRRMQFVNLFV